MKGISTICLALLLSAAGWPVGAQSGTAFSRRSAAELFGIDHVPAFAFTLPDDQWQQLQAHAKDEQDARVDVSFEGQPAGTAALRFKGSSGTLTHCFDETGALTCPKLSLHLSFDKYDAGNRFFGLKRLNLNSMVHDPTKLRERLTYDLYQQSGIKAPRSTWATATVNGKSYGLFSMVEEVDDVFTADRWPGNGGGNLYKEAWPRTTHAADYAKALETNKTTAKPDAMAAFAGDLANGDAAHLGTALAKWTDPAYMARYMAVDDAVSNCDGVTAMYSAGATDPGSNNHNFYFYQEQNRDVFWLIPWDEDQTFTGCKTFGTVPRWNSKPADCARNYPVWDHSFVHAPGCDALFQAIATRRDDYNAAVDALLAGLFAQQTIVDKIDRWTKFIHDAEVADATAGGEGPWMSAVSELKGAIPDLRNRLQGFRNGR